MTSSGISSHHLLEDMSTVQICVEDFELVIYRVFVGTD